MMKSPLRSQPWIRRLLVAAVIPMVLMTPGLLLGAAPELMTTVEPANGGGGWHAKSLGGALALTALFGLVGVVLAFIGYKFFDLCTPGDMHKEIFEHKNVAAAIVAAAVILGICVIIAAAMG